MAAKRAAVGPAGENPPPAARGHPAPMLRRIAPLTSYAELKEAVADLPKEDRRRSTVPLSVRPGTGHAAASRPRLLVCHDQMGGYHEDAELQSAVLP